MYDFRFSDKALTSWVLLRQAWTAMYGVAAARLRAVGLTPEKMDLLWICRDHPGPLNPAEISRLTSRETQTVAGLLNAMEKEGLLERIRSGKGRPFTEVRITADGREACGPGLEVTKDVITGMMSALSEEENEEFQRLLRLLLQKAAQESHLELGAPGGFAAGQDIPVDW